MQSQLSFVSLLGAGNRQLALTRPARPPEAVADEQTQDVSMGTSDNISDTAQAEAKQEVAMDNEDDTALPIRRAAGRRPPQLIDDEAQESEDDAEEKAAAPAVPENRVSDDIKEPFCIARFGFGQNSIWESYRPEYGQIVLPIGAQPNPPLT